ncbi:hypothetical protein F8M41_019682 [Gigaspora margarita]|uniref:Uncharacterized protein n=1 Tax=Gigaspora margarita TaxID=4874 RepID=A0A8H4EKF3_GIGMA|nr:hypothetical protein F8M41_019682 [Gigaspora margarita]
MPVNSLVQNCTISDPHSNAFIDVKGDYLADFNRSGNLPDGTGQISFVNMAQGIVYVNNHQTYVLQMAIFFFNIQTSLSEVPIYSIIACFTVNINSWKPKNFLVFLKLFCFVQQIIYFKRIAGLWDNFDDRYDIQRKFTHF